MGDTADGDDITALLRAWSGGDQKALEKLTPMVYGELLRLARRNMRYKLPGHSLQATELVNEVYLRLAGHGRIEWQNRAHFFAVSAHLMRRILVERRGGGRRNSGETGN